MQYRTLGKTGLKVSEISFGGIPIQRISAGESAAVIKEALNSGINFYDTARVYTDSEEKLGQALSGVPRQDVILASKSLFPSKEAIKKEVDKSLKLLRTDYIDLYQLHNVKSEKKLKKILAGDGALEGLKEARREGKIRFIGITSHKPEMLTELLKDETFSTIQIPFNIVEPEASRDIFPLARNLNLGIIIMKPLCGGALKNHKAALQYILNYPVSAVIPGMQSVEEVAENVAASGQPLSQSDMEKLNQEAAELGTRFCRRCEYCLPCPQEVNIPTNFLMYGYWKNYGLHKWAHDLYHTQKIKASACTQCGECEEKCPYDLPIREMMQKCKSVFEENHD